MKLIPIIRWGVDPDGKVRWSTIIENVLTNMAMCQLISADTQHEAESNAQQVYRLLATIILLNPSVGLDLSLWPRKLQ